MYPPSVENLNIQWIIPKLRQWTWGSTVDLGFAVCNWFLSDFYVYIIIVFITYYHWWICALVWFLYSFSFYYYLFNLFTLITFFLIKNFFSLSFALLFLLSHVADRVLLLRPGVRPETLRWERLVKDIGPPETSWAHVISNGESSPRCLHINVKTQLHPTVSRFQHWTPNAKQLTRQEHNTTH